MTFLSAAQGQHLCGQQEFGGGGGQEGIDEEGHQDRQGLLETPPPKPLARHHLSPTGEHTVLPIRRGAGWDTGTEDSEEFRCGRWNPSL